MLGAVFTATPCTQPISLVAVVIDLDYRNQFPYDETFSWQLNVVLERIRQFGNQQYIGRTGRNKSSRPSVTIYCRFQRKEQAWNSLHFIFDIESVQPLRPFENLYPSRMKGCIRHNHLSNESVVTLFKVFLNLQGMLFVQLALVTDHLPCLGPFI